MRRAGRIIYNLAVVVSLLLCLATVGVWVRSYWVSESLVWSTLAIDRIHYHEDTVRCERGGVQFSCSRTAYMFHPWIDDDDFHRYLRDAVQYPVYENQWEGVMRVGYQRHAALGFEWVPRSLSSDYDDSPASISEKSLTLPLYFPTLLFALLPAHYFLRVRRRRRLASRRARGCCVNCGYDLQATPDRCPECGAIPAKGAS